MKLSAALSLCLVFFSGLLVFRYLETSNPIAHEKTLDVGYSQKDVTPIQSPKFESDETFDVNVFVEDDISESKTLWQPIENDAKIDLSAKVSSIDEKYLVELERETLDKLIEGDSLALWVPGIENLIAMEVESTSRTSSGNKTVLGQLDDLDNSSFILTLGKHTTFATFESSEGIFNLRGDLNHAWLIPSRALRKQVGPTVSDISPTSIN